MFFLIVLIMIYELPLKLMPMNYYQQAYLRLMLQNSQSTSCDVARRRFVDLTCRVTYTHVCSVDVHVPLRHRWIARDAQLGRVLAACQ